MATKSFLKDVVIKDKQSAERFINALETAEQKAKKRKVVNTSFETIKDKEKIRELFSNMEN